MHSHRWTHVVSLLIGAMCFGGVACRSEPTNAKPSAEPTEQVKPDEAKANSEPAKPAAPEPVPGRFTKTEIENVLETLKTCVDESSDLAHMSACGCRSDLSLSKEPQPEDPEAYCGEFAKKTVASSERSESEQMIEAFPLAASDVPAPGSTGLFSFAAPCVIGAMKNKSTERYALCVCAAHTLANKMATETVKTNADVMQAFGRVTKDMRASGACQ